MGMDQRTAPRTHPRVEHRPDDFSMAVFRSMVFPDHLHTQIEIVLPTAGRLPCRVDGEEMTVGPGKALVVLPNRVHGYPHENGAEGLMLIFSAELLPDMGVNWASARPASARVWPLDGDAAYGAGRLWEIALRGEGRQSREVMALLHLLAAGLLKDMELRPADGPQVGDILYRALAYVSANYRGEVSLKKAAKAAGANEYYLSHLFNQRLRMDFRQYVNLLRLDKAKQYLTQKNLPVEEVAYLCGFSSLRSFDRVFRLFYGCTPREYRKG